MQAQAERKSVKNFKVEQQVNEKKDKKEERRKKANEGKAGGGAQVRAMKYSKHHRSDFISFPKGRETKTKATKKKYSKGRNDSDDEFEDDTVASSSSGGAEIEFMSTNEIKKVLGKKENLSDASEEFVEEIAARLQK